VPCCVTLVPRPRGEVLVASLLVMFMTKLNMGSGGNLEGVGLAEVALMMKRGNDTANILALQSGTNLSVKGFALWRCVKVSCSYNTLPDDQGAGEGGKEGEGQTKANEVGPSCLQVCYPLVHWPTCRQQM
jgi:hypothetical protein